MGLKIGLVLNMGEPVKNSQLKVDSVLADMLGKKENSRKQQITDLIGLYLEDIKS